MRANCFRLHAEEFEIDPEGIAVEGSSSLQDDTWLTGSVQAFVARVVRQSYQPSRLRIGACRPTPIEIVESLKQNGRDAASVLHPVNSRSFTALDYTKTAQRRIS